MGIFDFFKKKSSDKPIVQVNRTEISKIHIENKNLSTSDNDIPSLEERIKNAVPSKNGLYPHEIIMLDYAHTYKNSNNSFQNFWKWNYSVLEPQELLNSLFNRGFIKTGGIKSVLCKLKVNELKELLTNKNQKTTGKKDELIERIIANYNEDELNKNFPDRYFELTEKGETELKENDYVSYLHRHNFMTVWEMNQLLYNDNPSHLKYRDILWREFNKRSGEHFQNHDFGLYRNTRLNMHDFLMEEEKYKTAFALLAEVASFDLSGLGNGDKLVPRDEFSRKIIFESKMVNLFTNDKEEVTLPPGILRYFEKLYDVLEMSDEEFIEYTYKEFSQIKIHERTFNPDECANILLSEIGKEERKIKNSYAVAEQRVKKLLGM